MYHSHACVCWVKRKHDCSACVHQELFTFCSSFWAAVAECCDTVVSHISGRNSRNKLLTVYRNCLSSRDGVLSTAWYNTPVCNAKFQHPVANCNLVMQCFNIQLQIATKHVSTAVRSLQASPAAVALAPQRSNIYLLFAVVCRSTKCYKKMVAFSLLMSTSCIQLPFDLPYDNPKNSHRSLLSSHYPWRAPHPQPSLLPILCGWWTTALNHQTIKVYSFKCLERIKTHRALFCMCRVLKMRRGKQGSVCGLKHVKIRKYSIRPPIRKLEL